MNLSSIQLPTLKEIRNEKRKRELEEDLFHFLLWVFRVIYRRPFESSWHHEVMCTVLEDIYKGRLLHTVINIPPRYSKSEIVVKIFTAWCFAKNPKCEFINLAYSDDLALANSSAVREIISHEAYQELWPIEFKHDSQAKKKWKTTVGGEMSAAATGGSVTGFGAGKLGSTEFSGALIVDDPLKPEDSNSDTVRNGINNRFPQTIKSRLNDRKTPLIIIMQRLHEDDPAGFLLGGGTELKFNHVNLPAINEDGPSKYDPREVGEALWPFKHTEDELEAMRVSDAMGYAGQYQQRPAPAEGNIFRWFKYYKEVPEDKYYKVHSWDFTFKEKSKNRKGKVDYVVGTEWGKRRTTKDIYLFPDMVRARMGFTDSKEALEMFAEKHSDFKAVLVEDKANGSAIMDSIKNTIKKVIAIEPTGDKVERAEAVAPLFQAGSIYLPHKSICPWIEDFVNELKVFPNGKHDDQVDSTTQAIEYLDRVGGGSIKEAMKPQDPFRKTFENRKKDRKSRIKVKSD